MDRSEKFIRRLDRKTRDRIESAVQKILRNDLENLDIRPLEGYEDCFRCRIGTIRIIFEKYQVGKRLIDIGFRKDVYKRLKR